MRYDRKKSPSCFQRVVSVKDTPQTIIIERAIDSFYFLREVRAYWGEYAANGSAIVVEPHIEFVNAVSEIPLQNKPFPLSLIATPGPLWIISRYDAPPKRSVKLNDPILFRQHIYIRISLNPWYSSPLDITIMVVGYNVER